MVRLAVAVLGFVLLAAAAYFAPWPAGFLAGRQRHAAVFGDRPLRLARRRRGRYAGARPRRQAQRRHPDPRPVDRHGAQGRVGPHRQGDRHDQRHGQRRQPRDRKAVGADLARPTRRRRQPAHADNVVPHPSARRPRVAAGLPDAATPAPDHSAVEAAYRKAVAAGEFDLSLQPIVSVSRSAATGFEVFANLPVEGGQRVDLRRPARTIAGNRSGGVRAHPRHHGAAGRTPAAWRGEHENAAACRDFGGDPRQ